MSDSWRTLCGKCTHHILRLDTPRSHAWYNHFCGKTPLSKNDKLPLDRRYDACRYVNNGSCELYEEAAHVQ